MNDAFLILRNLTNWWLEADLQTNSCLIKSRIHLERYAQSKEGSPHQVSLRQISSQVHYHTIVLLSLKSKNGVPDSDI